MINFYNVNTYLFFLLGTILGYYINIILYRLPREIPLFSQKSHCPNCKEILHWYERIPLLSFLLVKGKCSHCQKKISVIYPLVEVLTGIIFALIYSFIIYKTQTFRYYDYILLIIAVLVIIGIFSDFLYHGTFDFSTIWVCIILFIYLCFANNSISIPIKMFIQSLSYFIPLIFLVLHIFFREKGNAILSVLSIVTLIIIGFMALLNFDFNMISTIYLGNALINWFAVYLFSISTDYIQDKILKSSDISKIISSTIEWFSMVTFFIFLFNKNEKVFNVETYKNVLSCSSKNIIILVLFTLFYFFIKETFELHDNDEEIIENNEEVIERDENIFSQYIGDGDLFIIPFVGMLLGYWNIFNFFVLMGLCVFTIYSLIFKKGFKYVIPLYPFIILSVVISHIILL